MQTAVATTETQSSPPPRRERRSRPVDRMTGIAVRIHGSCLVASFDLDGAHYHYWYREDGKTPISDTLHKGLPLDLPRSAPSYFKPTYCKATSKANAPLIAKLFETIERDGLIAKAHEAEAENRRAEAERDRQSAISYAKSQCGDQLYATLQELLRCTAIPEHWAASARATLATVDAKIASTIATIREY